MNDPLKITRSPTRMYGFTLRKTKLENVSKEAYQAHMYRLPIKCTDVCYEMESGLHCHGIAYVPRGLDMRRLRFRGWRLHLEELYDVHQWMMYCNKHQDEPLPDMVDSPDDGFEMPKHRLIPKK